MIKTKSKIIGLIGATGALCALCCALPAFGLLGLGTLEAFFCENEKLQGMGITLAIGAVVYFAFKFFRRSKQLANSCTVNCGCKTN